mgnify:CR=1 FL=1
MSTEVFYLWNPELTQLVTFKIRSGTHEIPDWDYAEITWTGGGHPDHPAFEQLDDNRMDTDRYSAQILSQKLETKGYKRHLLGTH